MDQKTMMKIRRRMSEETQKSEKTKRKTMMEQKNQKQRRRSRGWRFTFN
jgi:hypothetical protein